MTLLHLANVIANADENPVRLLDEVTLTVRTNEIMAVLGPSGSGKTSLLKVVAGLLPIESGAITYDQQALKDIPVDERRIGMIFQSFALYPNYDAGGNIGFYFRIRRQPEKIPQRIRDISQLMNVELDYLLKRRIGTLSGGEKQRVAIARAMVREPRLFLFDEPFSNIDAQMRGNLRLRLKQMLMRYPVTTLYVTHDQDEAIALANRIAIMRDGKIVQVGSYGELTERPNDQFVADFVGGCNFLNGVVDNGQWILGDIRIPAPPAKAPNGKRLTLGIRPGDFEPAANGLMTLRIDKAVPIFERRIHAVDGRIAGQAVRVELPQSTELDAEMGVKPTKIHWFDSISGVRLPL